MCKSLLWFPIGFFKAIIYISISEVELEWTIDRDSLDNIIMNTYV